MILALGVPAMRRDVFALTISSPLLHSAERLILCSESLIDELRNSVETCFPYLCLGTKPLLRVCGFTVP